MSNWFQNVGSLLEKLDDQAEKVSEELVIAKEEEAGIDGQAVAAIDDILNKRGLSGIGTAESNDEGDTEENETQAKEEKADLQETSDTPDEASSQPPSKTLEKSPTTIEEHTTENSNDTKSFPQPDLLLESPTKDSPPSDPSILAPKAESENHNSEESNDTPTNSTQPQSHNGTKTSVPSGPVEPSVDTPSSSGVVNKAPSSLPSAEAKEAAKEARTLRRHVVALNKQLESAENELQAQRVELERAAERMEKDRKRSKEEKEKKTEQHNKEIGALRASNEQKVKEIQARFDERLATSEKKINDMEHRRKQEGGDWSKEMENAIDREQEMHQKVTHMENEKSTLLNQLSTLQVQQAALGSRLESLTQAADDAMARERDAEDRLDTMLSQHARQITQRQTREAELERQIQELNQAVVKNGTSSTLDSIGSHDTTLRARQSALETDLETALGNLTLEREKGEALSIQLQKMSKESTQEASASQMKEHQYDRKLAEMSLTISKLQATVREAEQQSNSPEATSRVRDPTEAKKEVALLSEEIFRLREKLGSHNGEFLTLKTRLKTAVERATVAEEALVTARAERSTDPYDSMERGSGGTRRRRTVGNGQSISIRSAMMLNPGNGERVEKIGKVVDAVDSFSVTTGKFLRKNPFARAGFLFYLLLIHLWTFVLLFFHAHNFEVEHGDFGGMAHTPEAVLHQQVQSVVEIQPDAAQVVTP